MVESQTALGDPTLILATYDLWSHFGGLGCTIMSNKEVEDRSKLAASSGGTTTPKCCWHLEGLSFQPSSIQNL